MYVILCPHRQFKLTVKHNYTFLETDLFRCFLQAGRTRRSHAEDEGRVKTKGRVGQTTPAVAASERRKSLKLVGGQKEEEETDCLQLNCKRKKRKILSAQVSFFPSGLSFRVGPLHPVSVSPPQLLWSGCPQYPSQTVEQQFHRGKNPKQNKFPAITTSSYTFQHITSTAYE